MAKVFPFNIKVDNFNIGETFVFNDGGSLSQILDWRKTDEGYEVDYENPFYTVSSNPAMQSDWKDYKKTILVPRELLEELFTFKKVKVKK